MDTVVMDRVAGREVKQEKVKAEKKEYCKQQALDRIGETRTNNCNSTMWIIDYTDSQNVTVQFSNGFIAHVTYNQFKSGSVKNPDDISVWGHGKIGFGEQKAYINGKATNVYSIWNAMLQRCFSQKIKAKYPTYKDCTVSDDFLNFQTFSRWYKDNYYEIKGESESLQLDKDILYPGNKIYSPETCCLLPRSINVLFTKNDASRGELPIGVSLTKNDRYMSRCQIGTGKKQYLGTFDTPQDAFIAYKEFKEQRIKDIADQYKSVIPLKLYNAMYNYQVVDDLVG
ncbi:hypothetical protein [Desulfitobacterium metallireducens]|uniref:AP2/ERF domain-containing protein n=1 Tax=Desulfitobacterium metallireducens DSM 15288 TaxID=871968 RepID=W0EHN0_9FIRM|nr:hypothetical protein [Desulfitobacterium metallireducens]AHF08581.1 hypothetical protein DESME_08995 [Desulfitobacterium metallireducens DSM 15288]